MNEVSRHSATPGQIATANVPRLRHWSDVALIAAFLAAITLPLFQMRFPVLPESSTSENRRLAPFPEWPTNVSGFLSFPAQFESYFNDHFGFRNRLIRWNNVAKHRWLGESPIVAAPQRKSVLESTAKRRATERKSDSKSGQTSVPSNAQLLDADRAMRGKDDWLFAMNDSLQRYYRGQLLTEEQLSECEQEFAERNSFLAERNIHYLVVICPEKSTILPEFLPDSIRITASRLRADQFVEVLQRAHVEVVDLRPVIAAASKERQCFHKTDSHWNDYGAYLGYRAIIEKLSAWYPQLRPWDLSSFNVEMNESKGGDLATMLGLQEDLTEVTTNLIPIDSRQAQPPFDLQKGIWRWTGGEMFGSERSESVQNELLPTAVVFHDSVGFALNPYLAEHFSDSYLQFAGLLFRHQTIDKEKPNIVLQIFTERRLASDPLPLTPAGLTAETENGDD